MDTIGVLLSRREWNNLRRNKNIKDGFRHFFTKKANELKLKVVFVTLDHMDIPDFKTEALEIGENAEIKKMRIDIPSIIYNPTKFYLKKYIKKLRELSNHSRIQVMNEHHIIKRKNLVELIQSKPELNIKLEKENDSDQVPLNFYVLGQKNTNMEWETPIIYVKDVNGEKFFLESASPILKEQQQTFQEIEELLTEHSNKLLKMIHYYYPGIYEIGILFSINKSGDIYLSSTCSFNIIMKDLFDWNFELCVPLFETALSVAKKLIQQNITSIEVNNLTQPLKLASRNEYFSGWVKESKQLRQYMKNRSSIWIKLRPYEDDKLTLQLPSELIHYSNRQLTTIQFGIKEQTCYIMKAGAVLLNNNTYHAPIEILISNTLLNKMHLQPDLVYQLKILGDKVIIGPSIGLLLGEKNQLYNPAYMEKFTDRLGIYEKFGGVVIAFSTRSIDWEEKIAYGLIYNPLMKKWEFGSAPIPAAIYRRNFHQRNGRVKKLIKLTDNKLFNSYHYKKSDLLKLQEEKKINKYLPKTHLLKNMPDLIQFVNVEQKVILKPVSLSRGRGIFVIEKNVVDDSNGYILYDHRKEFRLQHFIPDEVGLEEMLRKLVMNEKYLYQTYIPLLKVNNRPFDVRVVMQKFHKEQWICSGIECRVAGEKEVLTNIARGGEAMTLEEVVRKAGDHLSFEKVQKDILTLCQNFCRLMDETDEHYGEFGLDIGLDQDGYPWMIEANIFPSFKGFKAMDNDTYLKIRYQPLYYAVHLQDFSIFESEEEMKDEIFHPSYSNS
ncbi:YheC/YheD family endospore coat-associated protein [Neobacillus mesonae]|uniref:YheC/YheD family endospore coat-associated protein n=1 Tax=Neobacillus mesonae TaxID=1193713 RepID=UPI00082D825C|nr:YheC/YheD family protein [Neobacillus mesonae]